MERIFCRHVACVASVANQDDLKSQSGTEIRTEERREKERSRDAGDDSRRQELYWI